MIWDIQNKYTRHICICKDCKSEFFAPTTTSKYCPNCKKNAALSKLKCNNSNLDFFKHEIFPKSKCKICRGTGYSIKNQKPCWECSK